MPVRLTCCGLQEQQGEEAADQDGALHDGCQENSDSRTDYIYSGGKVKGQAGKGRRGPERWSSWWSCGDGVVVLVGGVRGVSCALGVCRSHDMPGGRYGHEQLPVIFRETAAPALTSALVTPPPGFRTDSLVLSAVISRSRTMQDEL